MPTIKGGAKNIWCNEGVMNSLKPTYDQVTPLTHTTTHESRKPKFDTYPTFLHYLVEKEKLMLSKSLNLKVID